MTNSTAHDIGNVYICPHGVLLARVCSQVGQFLSNITKGSQLQVYSLKTIPITNAMDGILTVPIRALDIYPDSYAYGVVM